MKAKFVFLLVAALVALHFTSASPTNLRLRRSNSLTNCLEGADCKEAIVVPSSSELSQIDTCETLEASKTSTDTSSHTSTNAAQITAPTAPVVQGCNYDNCLRQAIQSEVVVVPFCNSYTTAAQTSTAGYPAYISMCNNQPSSISSACTCLNSAQTPTQSSTAAQSQTSSIQSQITTAYPTTIQSQTASETHTSTNAGVATTESSSHHGGHLTTVVIWTTRLTTITGGGAHSSSPTETTDTSCTTTSSETSSPISIAPSSTNTQSTLSTSVKKSPHSTSYYSTTTRTTLVTVFHLQVRRQSILPLSSSTPVVKSSTIAASVTSSTTSSATPVSTTWVTFPPSEGIKVCAASQDCVNGASIYSQCVRDEVNGNQTLAWNCLCKTNAEWQSTVLNCAACVAKNLPSVVNGVPASDLVLVLNQTMNLFCSETAPVVLASSVSGLAHTGLYLTDLWESPIDFFNLTLLAAPAPPFATASSSSSSIVHTGTSTILSSVTVVPVRASTTSTTSTSATSASATSTPSTWITLPASDAMKQCQGMKSPSPSTSISANTISADTCQPAAQVFNGCTLIQLNLTNQDPIFDCFCTIQKALWQSTLSACATCVAAALPVNNPATGPYQASHLVADTELTRSIYCNQTDASVASTALAGLGAVGNVLTTKFELPIDFFGMTLLTAPIAPITKRDDGMLPSALLEDFQT
ncbi:hypothetical protein L207DRAFT_634723 [Hyaloscypha variabilis F]|uniref:Extracellular membrane protein CFEM domain-containing protein n=1 Tax=Hyaloscypha variabilis (strain UAMH 11265 / GT02V1 / F) TaxID=1149755 RepID=A0A2J6RJN5_HYAVF|nr:hypothetical protein L207DRAFT_634723 [Hyaloscypha variabilis F]